jgi:hypothetical protein
MLRFTTSTVRKWAILSKDSLEASTLSTRRKFLCSSLLFIAFENTNKEDASLGCVLLFLVSTT